MYSFFYLVSSKTNSINDSSVDIDINIHNYIDENTLFNWLLYFIILCFLLIISINLVLFSLLVNNLTLIASIIILWQNFIVPEVRAKHVIISLVSRLDFVVTVFEFLMASIEPSYLNIDIVFILGIMKLIGIVLVFVSLVGFERIL